MTTAAPTGTNLSTQQLGILFQYTVEAYKAFEKLAESLPNPLSMTMFKEFALDERMIRDLLEMKVLAHEGRVRATLGGDMSFLSMHVEGELSYRESAEFLISRERAMQRKLREFTSAAAASDRNLLIYMESIKRVHIVELERELELIRHDSDWWKREDAESRIVHGSRSA